MKNFRTLLFVLACGATFTLFSSCSDNDTKQPEPQPQPQPQPATPDHFSLSGLSFQAKGDLGSICSEIKISILQPDGKRSYVTLSETDGYKWEQSFESSTLPASGGFSVHCTLKSDAELTQSTYTVSYKYGGTFMVIDTEGGVMDTQALSFSPSLTVQKGQLAGLIDSINKRLDFYYQADAQGNISEYKPTAE